MIDLHPDHLKIIKAILERLVPDRPVWAFGSRMTGNAKPHSDLDIAILGDKKIPAKILGDLRAAFAESDLPIQVDLVDWNRIEKSFQELVQKKYEVVQGL